VNEGPAGTHVKTPVTARARNRSPACASCGDLVEGVGAVEEVDHAVEPPSQGVAANVARHLPSERDELCQPLCMQPAGSLATLELCPDCRPVGPGRSRDLRFGHRHVFPQRDQKVASAIVGAESSPSSHARRGRRRVPIADHELRRAVVAPSPRLGLAALALVAAAHHLVDDLIPSLDADAPPIWALEHGEQLTVRVTKAGSDLDLHGRRIRLDDG